MNPFDQLKQQATNLETRGKARLKAAFKRKGSGTTDAASPAAPAANTAAAPTPTNQAANLVGKAADAASPPANLKDYESALNNAHRVIGAMGKLPGAADKTSQVSARIKAANDILSKADGEMKKSPSKDQVDEQIKALREVSTEARKAKEESDKYAKAHPANLGDFEDKLKDAHDRVAKARTYRGAFLDADHKHPILKDAEELLELAASAARGAKSDEARKVAASMELLKGLDSKLQALKDNAEKSENALNDKFDAYPKWSKRYAAAKDARDALANDPLATEEHRKICQLITRGEDALREDGAVEAIKKLGDFTVFVEDAAQRRADLKKAKPDPAVEAAIKALEPVLEKHAQIAPEHMTSAHRDTIEQQRFLALKKAPEAAKNLGDLKTAVETEMTDLKKARDEAALKHKAFNDKAQSMVDAGMDPGLFDFLKKQAQRVIERDFAAHEWERTHGEFDRLKQSLEDLEKAQGQKSKEWKDGAQSRADMRKRAVELAGWPPLTQQAMDLRALLDGLDKELQGSLDYVAIVQRFNELAPKKALDQLEKDYATYDGRPEKSGNTLENIQKELPAARELYIAAETKTDQAVKKAESQLEGLADRGNNPLRADLRAVDKAWRTYTQEFLLKKAPWADFKAPTGTTGADMAAPFVLRLGKIEADALKADKNHRASTHDEFQKKALEVDATAGDDDLPAAVKSLLDQLGGLRTLRSNERDEYRKLQAETDPDKQKSGLRAFRKTFQERLDRKKRESDAALATKVEQAQGNLKLGVDAPLKKLKGSHKGYEAYHRELEAQASDLAAMAESGDPDLLEACKEQTDKLRDKVKAIDPRQRGAEATRYKEVDDAIKALGEALGGEIRKYLPNTHQALTAKLVDLKGEVGRSSPRQGLGLLGNMQIEVKRAQTRAEDARQQREGYKQAKGRLEKQWARVRKLTDTRITDRTTHFADRFTEQMAQADSANETEPDEKNKNSGPALGMSLLGELKGFLDKIEGSGDGAAARVALQEKDAEFAQENLFIQDLARDFKLQVQAFRSTVIPSARELLEKQNGDLEMLENLEASIKSATKTVQPYLDMLSSLPKPGKPKAPKRSQAEQDFKTAQSALTAANRTVTALRNGVGTTDVDITGDLKKVEANWREKTKKYSQAVNALADEVAAAADDANKDNAEKAAKLIRSVADDFLPQAFAPEIHILSSKDNATAQNKPRLAAREKALKIMRANRKVLQEHPVHTQLTEANAAFKGSKVNGAARDLLIALKRLELEVLVGA